MSLELADITVHCIGNAHIDPVWRWPWQEGYAETLSTCHSALDRLAESDDFIFSRGQAATYAWVEECAPAMFEQIQTYVREGRWNIVNGWWEQPDCNIPCGESYVRHALYGKRYFKQKFGVDVTTGWNPDTFGHNVGLPQILARSGFKTYCFFRPGRHEKELPGPFFWWIGPDGSRVLNIRPPVGHYCTGGESMAEEVLKAAQSSLEMGLKHAVLFYGVGNHGGGPTKENIKSIRSVNEDAGGPQAIFSTVEQFAEAVKENYDSFPTVTEDLQHHAPGCYATHSEIKRLNRHAENRLLSAERWCAIASLALGTTYPAAEFERAWRQVLFNQFHDILAGTSLPAAYDHAREQIGEATSIAARIQNASLQGLAAQIDTRVDNTSPPAAASGRPILIFNPSSWPRRDPVAVQWGWRGQESDSLVDDSGNIIPFQYTDPDIFGGGSRIFFEADIPAHGYRVYRFMPLVDSTPTDTAADLLAPQAGDTWLENSRWKLEFNADSGELVRLYDKKNQVETISGNAAALLVMQDTGDTWGHDIPSWREEIGRFGGAKFKVTQLGASRATLRIDTTWGSSTARQEFTLHRHSDRIDVKLTLDWHEKHQLLKLSIPVAVESGTLTYESAYSTIVREANGLEDPGQNWIDLSGTSASQSGGGQPYGFSLLNDSKFGFDCLGTDMRMTLLRSPIFCFHDPAQIDPEKEYLYMDQGIQVVNYALLPHTGDWREGCASREAHALNCPLEHQFQYAHSGKLGKSGTLLEVTPSNVHAVVLKGSEDGNTTILRIFESEGKQTEAVVTIPGGIQFEASLKPWELKSLRIDASGSLWEVNLLEE